jgi:hypothetical protein
MKVTLLHDTYDSEHLNKVLADMKKLGAPTIRAFAIDENNDWYQAIEGSHRLRACEILGIMPTIEILDEDTPFVNDENQEIIDWDGPLIKAIGELGDIDNYSIEF